jgi:hypothetical protein
MVHKNVYLNRRLSLDAIINAYFHNVKSERTNLHNVEEATVVHIMVIPSCYTEC